MLGCFTDIYAVNRFALSDLFPSNGVWETSVYVNQCGTMIALRGQRVLDTSARACLCVYVFMRCIPRTKLMYATTKYG